MAEQPHATSRSTPAGHRIPVPMREDLDRLVKRVAGPSADRKRPAGKDQPPEQSGR